MTDWKKIDDSTPRDRRIMLWVPRGTGVDHQAEFGRWDDDRFAKKPRPHWSWQSFFGKTFVRNSQPKYWAEAPAAPSEPTP